MSLIFTTPPLCWVTRKTIALKINWPWKDLGSQLLFIDETCIWTARMGNPLPFYCYLFTYLTIHILETNFFCLHWLRWLKESCLHIPPFYGSTCLSFSKHQSKISWKSWTCYTESHKRDAGMNVALNHFIVLTHFYLPILLSPEWEFPVFKYSHVKLQVIYSHNSLCIFFKELHIFFLVLGWRIFSHTSAMHRHLLQGTS